jgi:hypothetical protein
VREDRLEAFLARVHAPAFTGGASPLHFSGSYCNRSLISAPRRRKRVDRCQPPLEEHGRREREVEAMA